MQRLGSEKMGVHMVFPMLFGFEVFSTFTVLRMCPWVLPKANRQWVVPGPQPTSDFVLMIWGRVHLPDGIPPQAQETLGMLPLGAYISFVQTHTYWAATVVAKLLRARGNRGRGRQMP